MGRLGGLVCVVVLAWPALAHADLDKARSHLRTGAIAKAKKAAKAAAKKKATRADAQVLLAEIEAASGRNAEAVKGLDKVLDAQPDHRRARWMRGLVAEATGDDTTASRIWNGFFDDWDAGRITKSEPEALAYLADAARYLGDFQGANDTFGMATDGAPSRIEAQLRWAELFLEKYAVGEAEVSYQAVLAIDPKHPDAHAGMARVVLERDYDVPVILGHVDQALAVDPGHVGALEVRATVEMDDGDYRAAKKTLGKALKRNPADREVHAMLAAVAWLQDDSRGYEAERKKTLAIDPTYARFYDIVAAFGDKAHRYADAIALGEEAIALDPKDATALAAVGIGYLRLGDEDKGLPYLRKAFDADRFNVRVYNTLNAYEEIAKGYVLFDSGKHFRIRSATSERAVIEKDVVPVLEAAFDDMAKRYGFVPGRVTVELYADHDLYSSRTVGLPNLGADGICFGSVITTLSPSAKELNWGMVLHHELGHAFAIQLSKSRVPRWFTEGLSEYEALTARREWARHLDAEIWRALRSKELLSIDKLDRGFLRARSIEEIVRAYHQASLTIQFLVETYGFPAIVDALEGYGAGKDTATVLQEMTGLGLAKLDKKFRAYLTTRLAAYADADQYDAAAGRGRAAIERGDLTEAKTQLDAAKGFQPERSEPYAMLYLAYKAAGDAGAAAAELEGHVYREPYDGAAMKELVALHAAAKRWDKVVEFGEMARFVDPFDKTLAKQLASAYKSR